MRQAHPGCGEPASGQGYNSGGNFCGGWAGNCGDGGMGGSTWYLMCDACRSKYLRDKKHIPAGAKANDKERRLARGGGRKKSLTSPSKHASFSQTQEAHEVS